jgi:hypothetical protein
MYKLELKRHVNAPPHVAWEVISDHTFFGEAAPNLHSVEVLKGDSLGMQRRCTGADGVSWTEECVLWREGEVYAFEVDASAPGYPLARMRGTFGLKQHPSGVLISVRFDYLPRFNPPLLGWLMDKALKRAALPTVRTLMDRWEAEIVRRVQQRHAA